MKNIFKLIGFTTLIIFTFIYTKNVSNIIKNNDKLFNQIKLESKKLNQIPINAEIKNNQIVPGKKGKQIDIEKSYYQMKQINQYNKNMLVFKEINPKVSIKNNKDKFITKGRKDISLIFKIDKDEDIDKISNILNKNKINASFLVNDFNIKLLKHNHNIIFKDYNMFKNILVRSHQKSLFCYTESKDKSILKKCKNNYIIYPNLIINSNYYLQIKNNLQNGSIISLPVNNEVINDLPLLIKYIKHKGLNIVNLEELLAE